MAGARSVLSRAERIKKLQEGERWTPGQSPYGLPKVRVQIIVLKKWDERKLAYEMEKQKRGLYVLCYFRNDGTGITGLERDVRLSEQVLRVLITRADHVNETEMAAVEPQPIAPPREDRPSWETDSRPRRPRRDDKDESSEGSDSGASE